MRSLRQARLRKAAALYSRAMATYRAVQVPEAGGDFELVERELLDPGRNEVRVTVQACGICHSDTVTKLGILPMEYPRVPGHEIAGVVDAVGEGVADIKPGDRVGVGWFGGSCFRCDPCRRGDFIECEHLKIAGISYDGGYAESVLVPLDALARVPDDLSSADAAPLLCAGITTFNALRHSAARPGDVVAILGVGGLGHLGVQYAAKMGFHTVAIARGADKRALAIELGAHVYIDSTTQDIAAELKKLGGAIVVLATVTHAPTMSAAIDGLGHRGQLVVVGVDAEPMQVAPMQLVAGSRRVLGHASGTSKDSEDTLDFSSQMKIAPRIETYPLEEAAAAYERMMSGKARFRVVLTTGR
jgi:D-arabinose 1-dehydrogenase-like Zn-dependent alcohol dehydrogenase